MSVISGMGARNEYWDDVRGLRSLDDHDDDIVAFRYGHQNGDAYDAPFDDHADYEDPCDYDEDYYSAVYSHFDAMIEIEMEERRLQQEWEDNIDTVDRIQDRWHSSRRPHRRLTFSLQGAL